MGKIVILRIGKSHGKVIRCFVFFPFPCANQRKLEVKVAMSQK